MRYASGGAFVNSCILFVLLLGSVSVDQACTPLCHIPPNNACAVLTLLVKACIRDCILAPNHLRNSVGKTARGGEVLEVLGHCEHHLKDTINGACLLRFKNNTYHCTQVDKRLRNLRFSEICKWALVGFHCQHLWIYGK